MHVSACPALLTFGSIFPQLSVSEMEPKSALNMKHIEAILQGGVHHKVGFHSEAACCVQS